MKIRDVMTPDIDAVTPDETLRTAARLMADLDLGALPVSEDNQLIGIVTGRDLSWTPKMRQYAKVEPCP
jgi:CBS domain-containing protein